LIPLRVLVVLPCLLLTVIAPRASRAQGNPSELIPMPSDPVELMALAGKLNGLTGTDIKPWRLKAGIDVLDDNGAVKDKVSYEELWAGATRYKISYVSPDFTRVDYGTPNGVLRSGPEDGPLPLVTQMALQLRMPVPEGAQSRKFLYTVKKAVSGATKLTCATITGNVEDKSHRTFTGPTYCVQDDRPVVRVISLGPGLSQVLRNNLAEFQGRYVAKDVQIVSQSKVVARAHIDNIEILDSADESLFLPSPDAKPRRLKITISAGVAQGNLASQVPPSYPSEAKARGVQGTVVLHAVISSSGHIRQLSVVSGAQELQQAAIDAVRQWVYRPYLLNGEPVEVETQINVVFSLRR
jgi:TonB family protein